MRSLIAVLNGLLPSFLAVPLYRMRGFSIGRGTRIRMGTFLFCRSCSIGAKGRIGPLVVIRAKEFSAGDYALIRPLTALTTPVIQLGRHVQVSGPTVISSDQMPQAFLKVGDHCRIFPFCWLETGGGITLGRQVGVGGHTQIFTHGYWSNYLQRGPISFGPVVVEDDVWIAWRVFIMPNVVIGKKAIVAANAVVNKSIPAGAVAAGNPAKVVKQMPDEPLTYQEQAERVQEILEHFVPFADYHGHQARRIDAHTIQAGTIRMGTQDSEALQTADLALLLPTEDAPATVEACLHQRLKTAANTIDLVNLQAWLFTPNPAATLMVSYLRKYGIRLYLNHGPAAAH